MPDLFAPGNAGWSVFLSSTVRDLKAYRRSIRDACRRRAQTLCLLSEEDWPGGYDDTVAKCAKQIRASKGFLLIVGHWYGSIPGGADRSVTHIEFDTALDWWKTADPKPIEVMVPQAGSRADRELYEAARSILQSEKRKGRVDPKVHREQLEKFRRAVVTDSWRTVTYFKNKAELREIAIACCHEFKQQSFIAAATGAIAVQRAPVQSQVSESQLGALGREPQLGAAKAILSQLAESPDVPAVAMIAFGDEDAGQRAFLQRLIDTVLKKHTPRQPPSTLPVQVDANGLSAWVSGLLGFPTGAAALRRSSPSAPPSS
jgi:hypothetical protein